MLVWAKAICRWSAIGGCVVVVGCMTAGTGATGDQTSLTTTESASSAAAVASVETLVSAANAVQGVASDTDLQTAATSPGFSAGTCPMVTVSTGTSDSRSLSLVVDFGDGCAVAGSSDYIVSGLASGTARQTDAALEISFDNLQSNGNALDGNVDVTYQRSGNTIGLSGDWDLGYASDATTTQTSGTGAVSYDSDAAATTISDYTGMTTSDGTSWSVGMSSVQVSYQQNTNFIPQSGSVTVSGADIRTFTMTFDQDSPTNGVVMVSIEGGPSFQLDLFSL